MFPCTRNRNEGAFECSPVPTPRTRAHSDVSRYQNPQQGHIRQNHPFTKPPFCFLSNLLTISDPFLTQISGKNFLPEVCGEVFPETAPLQAVWWCVPFAPQNRALFEGEKRCREKGRKWGWPAKGAKKEKRTHENSSRSPSGIATFKRDSKFQARGPSNMGKIANRQSLAILDRGLKSQPFSQFCCIGMFKTNRQSRVSNRSFKSQGLQRFESLAFLNR